MDGIKPRLADLERRARSFRSEVICGVRVDASEAKDASLAEKAVGLVDWVPGVDEGKKTVPWHEDPPTSAKNASLMREYASLVEQVSSAATRCASDINDLVERRQTTPAATARAESLTDPGASLPWGSPAAKGGSCPEAVGHRASSVGGGIAGGVGKILGGVDWLDSETYGQAWAGATTIAGVMGLLGSGRRASPGGSSALGAAKDAMASWTSSKSRWSLPKGALDGDAWRAGGKVWAAHSGSGPGARLAVQSVGQRYAAWKESGLTWFEGLFVPWGLPKSWREHYLNGADISSDWLNKQYKNHIAGLSGVAATRRELAWSSKQIGRWETAPEPLKELTPPPGQYALPIIKDEVDDWNHILRDPKGWWDQASGIDQAGIGLSFAGTGVIGKGATKGTKELVDFLGSVGKHGDDVKKAPTSPKSSGGGDASPDSGRRGSDGGPRKSDPDAPKKQGSDDPAPKPGSDSPDGGKPHKDGGGDRAGSTAKDEGGSARKSDDGGARPNQSDHSRPDTGDRPAQKHDSNGRTTDDADPRRKDTQDSRDRGRTDDSYEGKHVKPDDGPQAPKGKLPDGDHVDVDSVPDYVSKTPEVPTDGGQVPGSGVAVRVPSVGQAVRAGRLSPPISGSVSVSSTMVTRQRARTSRPR